MAIINKTGKLIANVSQPMVIFKDATAYNTWVASLPAPADEAKFAVVKDYDNRVTLKTGGVLVNLEGTPLLLDFIPSTQYLKNQIIANLGYLYRAKNTFTTTLVFSPLDWEVISYDPTKILDLTPGESYFKYQVVFYNEGLWRSQADFTYTVFNPAEWVNISNVYSKFRTFKETDIYGRFEGVFYNGQIFRNIGDDTMPAGPFDHEEWQCLSTPILDDFIPNFSYFEGALIYRDGKLLRANSDIPVDPTYDDGFWDVITEEVFLFDNAKDYPATAIVIDGSNIFLTLQDVPAGTALTNTLFYKPVGGGAIPEMTQAAWAALPVKPEQAIITDSKFDI